MSDDEEVIYTKPQKTIHYGSLETNDWVKQTLEEIQSDEDEYEPEKKKLAIAASASVAPIPTTGIQPSANIHVSNEYFDLEQEM